MRIYYDEVSVTELRDFFVLAFCQSSLLSLRWTIIVYAGMYANYYNGVAQYISYNFSIQENHVVSFA